MRYCAQRPEGEANVTLRQIWQCALQLVTQCHAIYGKRYLKLCFRNHPIRLLANQWHALWGMGTSYCQQQRHVTIIHTEKKNGTKTI